MTLAPILITLAPMGSRWAAAIYASGVIGVFGVSGAYHRLAWDTRYQALFRRLDHSMIFVFIAATYTPIAALALDGAASTFVLWFVWSSALVGIVLRLAWIDAPGFVTIAPYLLTGWCILFVIDDVWRSMGVAGFILLLVGGLLYSIGATVFAAQAPNPSPKWFGYHEVFHALVVGAVAIHYVAVVFFALPKA